MADHYTQFPEAGLSSGVVICDSAGKGSEVGPRRPAVAPRSPRSPRRVPVGVTGDKVCGGQKQTSQQEAGRR